MNGFPIVERIQLTRYRFPFHDVGYDLSFAMGAFYSPGQQGTRSALGIRIHTDEGVTGEYVSIAPATFEQINMFAPFLIGKNALERERFYNQAKVILRKNDRMGIGPIDIALWDLAGKLHQAPVYRLLGGYREDLPTYASTYHADRTSGGLDCPEAFADFAEQCLEMGYRGFKIHSWGEGPISQEVATVHAVGRRVGGKMALMIDPCCAYNTYAEALQVGRACDAEGFFWYEDPLKDGGVSHYAHRQLRRALTTPLLQGEHLHLVEAHVDMAAAEATDFARADPEYDGGITGVMKIAHASEGFGMDLELHIAGPAQRHCMAAMRNSNFYEMGLVHPKLDNIVSLPIYQDGYADELTSVDGNGCVQVPQGPGLGVGYDWAEAERYRVDEVVIK